MVYDAVIQKGLSYATVSFVQQKDSTLLRFVRAGASFINGERPILQILHSGFITV